MVSKYHQFIRFIRCDEKEFASIIVELARNVKMEKKQSHKTSLCLSYSERIHMVFGDFL